MPVTVLQSSGPWEDVALRAMFEARKNVFVDLLRWDLAVLDGRFELDQFDDALARYLVVTSPDGRHLGSARMLPTDRPHLLDTLFAELCERTPPSGPNCLEITRFCLDRDLRAADRLLVRNQLVAALARYALAHGVATYTGVAELGWLQQILAFGWHCRPLGYPRSINGRMLGALEISIDHDTPDLLAANGIGQPAELARAA